MQVGFIGLGRLGRPMATNLLNGGFDVTVYNRSQGKIQEMVNLGARASSAPAAIAAAVDSLHICLPDVATVESIITGPSGVLGGAQPGLILVDHSTVDPETSRKIGLAAEVRGVRFLDAPVSVTGDINLRGSITMMVGGEEAAFKQVQPVLEAEAAIIRWVGPVGSGSITKLINNMVMGTNKVITMESIVLGTKAGVDPSALYDFIQNASGQTTNYVKRTGNWKYFTKLTRNDDYHVMWRRYVNENARGVGYAWRSDVQQKSVSEVDPLKTPADAG